MTTVLVYFFGLISGICVAAFCTSAKVGDMENEIANLRNQAGGSVGEPASVKAHGPVDMGTGPGPAASHLQWTI